MNRHLERYRQIADVLSRHGLGFIVGVVGLGRWVPFHRGVLGHERRQEPYTTPEHLRLAIEELGPTFIKLGQLLSTRSDIVPADYLHELSKLQDAAPPVPPSTISALIESELGASPAGDLRQLRHRTAGQRVHRAGPSGHPAGRHPGRREGPPTQHQRRHRDRPGDPAEPRQPGEPPLGGGRELQLPRAGLGVRVVAAPRARLPLGGSERRTVRGQLRGQRGCPHPPRVLGDHDVSSPDPGDGSSGSRWTIWRASIALGSTAGTSPRRRPVWRSAWSSSTGSSTLIRTRATCSSSRAAASG